jgi:hypothetical protein
VRARIARAFGELLAAASARLRQHYAMRIGALAMMGRGDTAAALAALQAERDVALARMTETISEEKERAMHAVGTARAQPRDRSAAWKELRLRPRRRHRRGQFRVHAPHHPKL